MKYIFLYRHSFFGFPSICVPYKGTSAREGRVFSFLRATFNHTPPRSRATEASWSKGRSLQLVTTISSNCHDDLPNLSRRFNQMITIIYRLRAEEGEARVGKQRFTDSCKPSAIRQKTLLCGKPKQKVPRTCTELKST